MCEREQPRSAGVRDILRRIGREGFEVAGVAERQQRIASAIAGVRAAGDRREAGEDGERGDAFGEIADSPDEVVEVGHEGKSMSALAEIVHVRSAGLMIGEISTQTFASSCFRKQTPRGLRATSS